MTKQEIEHIRRITDEFQNYWFLEKAFSFWMFWLPVSFWEWVIS